MSFLVIGVMGMFMITFRTAYLPTQDADKSDSVPMEYNEAYEVEYNPSTALSPKDDAEDYGLEQADGNGGANVATGVAVGGPVGAEVAGAAVASSSMNDSMVDDLSQQTGGSQQADDSLQMDASKQDAQNNPSMFDDESWLNHPSEPVGAQY